MEFAMEHSGQGNYYRTCLQNADCQDSSASSNGTTPVPENIPMSLLNVVPYLQGNPGSQRSPVNQPNTDIHSFISMDTHHGIANPSLQESELDNEFDKLSHGDQITYACPALKNLPITAASEPVSLDSDLSSAFGRLSISDNSKGHGDHFQVTNIQQSTTRLQVTLTKHYTSSQPTVDHSQFKDPSNPSDISLKSIGNSNERFPEHRRMRNHCSAPETIEQTSPDVLTGSQCTQTEENVQSASATSEISVLTNKPEETQYNFSSARKFDRASRTDPNELPSNEIGKDVGASDTSISHTQEHFKTSANRPLFQINVTNSQGFGKHNAMFTSVGNTVAQASASEVGEQCSTLIEGVVDEKEIDTANNGKHEISHNRHFVSQAIIHFSTLKPTNGDHLSLTPGEYSSYYQASLDNPPPSVGRTRSASAGCDSGKVSTAGVSSNDEQNKIGVQSDFDINRNRACSFEQRTTEWVERRQMKTRNECVRVSQKHSGIKISGANSVTSHNADALSRTLSELLHNPDKNVLDCNYKDSNDLLRDSERHVDTLERPSCSKTNKDVTNQVISHHVPDSDDNQSDQLLDTEMQTVIRESDSSLVRQQLANQDTLPLNPESSSECSSGHKVPDSGFSGNNCAINSEQKDQESTTENEKVISFLKSNLKSKYNLNKEWQENFPQQCDLLNTPLSQVFDLEEYTKNSPTGTIIAENFPPSDLPNCETKRILLYARPKCGKTTICEILKYHWTSPTLPISKFKLCICISLRELNIGDDFLTTLVKYLSDVVSHIFPTNVLKLALEESGNSTLLIFDGYDELCSANMNKFKHFLRNLSMFSNSTVVVTSRPLNDPDFWSIFDTYVEVKGFSPAHLLPVLMNKPNENLAETYEGNTFFCQKLPYLSTLPPLYLSYISRLINSDLFLQKSVSLYKLLDRIHDDIASRKLTCSCGAPLTSQCTCAEYTNLKTSFLTLGKMFLRALFLGKMQFEEDALRKILGIHFDTVLSFTIFFEERKHGDSIWTVCDRILLVYFAVKYLRHFWSEKKNLDERIDFIMKELCLNACTVDYVISSEKEFYYVGLIPEIVLKRGREVSLEDATIEMYYDVDRMEHSHAFESTNLLLRTKIGNLRRFYFKYAHANDLPSCFRSIANSLTFENCCPDYKMYYNCYEDRNYMKVIVQSDERDVLRGVFGTTKGSVDKMRIEFSLLKLQDLFDFVTVVLSMHLKEFRFSENVRTSEIYEFIFSTVLSVLNCGLEFPVTLSCVDNDEEVREQSKSSNTFKCVYNSDTKENQVLSTCQFISKGEVVCIFNTYNVSQFRNAAKHVISDIRCRLYCNPWFTVTKI